MAIYRKTAMFNFMRYALRMNLFCGESPNKVQRITGAARHAPRRGDPWGGPAARREANGGVAIRRAGADPRQDFWDSDNLVVVTFQLLTVSSCQVLTVNT